VAEADIQDSRNAINGGLRKSRYTYWRRTMWRLFISGLTLSVTVVVLSTNAQAQLFVFPEKGQSPEQQEQDEFACYKWAQQQTGFNPNQQTTVAAAPPPQGGALKGAAGGAALGAIGGAIGGSAGKGAAIGAGVGGLLGSAKRRRGEMEYRQSVEGAAAEQKQKQETFNRAYGTCLGARGYKVG
jgi:hypothetical protein